MATSAAEVVLSPVTYLGLGIYYHYARHHLLYGAAFATYAAGGYVGLAGGQSAVSVAVWLFFRHPAVRRRFGPRADGG